MSDPKTPTPGAAVDLAFHAPEKAPTSPAVLPSEGLPQDCIDCTERGDVEDPVCCTELRRLYAKAIAAPEPLPALPEPDWYVVESRDHNEPWSADHVFSDEQEAEHLVVEQDRLNPGEGSIRYVAAFRGATLRTMLEEARGEDRDYGTARDAFDAERNRCQGLEAELAGMEEGREGLHAEANRQTAKIIALRDERDAALAAQKEAEAERDEFKAEAEHLNGETLGAIEDRDKAQAELLEAEDYRGVKDAAHDIAIDRAEKAEAAAAEMGERVRVLEDVLAEAREIQRRIGVVVVPPTTPADSAAEEPGRVEIEDSGCPVCEKPLGNCDCAEDYLPAEEPEPPCDRCQHGTFGCDDESGNRGEECDKFTPYDPTPEEPATPTTEQGDEEESDRGSCPCHGCCHGGPCLNSRAVKEKRNA